MTTKERNEGLLYILIFGAAHAWITWEYASTSLRAGTIMGACCILIWLILWFFIRQELRKVEWTQLPPEFQAEIQKRSATASVSFMVVPPPRRRNRGRIQ